jgi:hypothetical protein
MTNKELQDVLKASETVVNNVAVCELLNTEVQQQAKKETERPTAYDSLYSLYKEYTRAKQEYDNAVNHCLWLNEEFSGCANVAISFAVEAVAHTRGLSGFAKWFKTNREINTPFVSSLPQLTAYVLAAVKDYEKSLKAVEDKKTERKSLQERLAAARAALAAVEEEVAQADKKQADKK